MRTVLQLILGLALVALLSSCAGINKLELMESADLSDGWNDIVANGAYCSDGTDYNFSVKPGDPAKALLFLQGGGGCWNGMMCHPDLNPTYSINLRNDNPENMNGIFDLENRNNPFRNHTVIYIPYCTADVHLGSKVGEYTVPRLENFPGGEFEINHMGYPNAKVALDWIYEYLTNPSEFMVAGSSAGSVAVPVYAALIKDHYANARVVGFGDASGGYRGANFNPFDVWGIGDVLDQSPRFGSINRDGLGFYELFIAAGQRGDIVLASFDTKEDTVQKQFMGALGQDSESLLPTLKANLADISNQTANFSYFVADGSFHTILLRPQFYSLTESGFSFLEWFEELMNTGSAENVVCKTCN